MIYTSLQYQVQRNLSSSIYFAGAAASDAIGLAGLSSKRGSDSIPEISATEALAVATCRISNQRLENESGLGWHVRNETDFLSLSRS